MAEPTPAELAAEIAGIKATLTALTRSLDKLSAEQHERVAPIQSETRDNRRGLDEQRRDLYDHVAQNSHEIGVLNTKAERHGKELDKHELGLEELKKATAAAEAVRAEVTKRSLAVGGGSGVAAFGILELVLKVLPDLVK